MGRYDSKNRNMPPPGCEPPKVPPAGNLSLLVYSLTSSEKKEEGLLMLRIILPLTSLVLSRERGR